MALDNEDGIPQDAKDFVAPDSTPDQGQAQPEPDSKDRAWQEAHDRLPSVLLQHLRNGNADRVQSTMEFAQASWPKPPTDDELRLILESPEAQEAAREGLVVAFKFGSVERAQQILEMSKLPDGQFDSPAMQAAAKEGMVNVLQDGAGVESAINLHEAAGLPEEIWQAPEVQQAINGRLAKRRDNGGFGITTGELQSMLDANLVTKESLNTPDLQQAFETSFLRALREGDIDYADDLENYMVVPDGYMDRTEVRQAIIEGFDRQVSNYTFGIAKAMKIMAMNGLRAAEIAEPLRKAAIKYAESGHFWDLHQISEKFSGASQEINSPEVQAPLKRAVVEKLGNRYEQTWTPDQLRAFPYLQEILRSPEAQEALQKRGR